MIPDTNIEIILKNYNGVLDPISGKPFVHEKSNGETVPVAFTVGYKFSFGGELYGDFIEFEGEEPKLEAIEEAAKLVFDLALESYKMLCSGAKEVPVIETRGEG